MSPSQSKAPARIFIGSGEASLIERKTLIHSLQKHATRPLDIYVFNGTHNTIEHGDEPPRLAPLPLKIKYLNVTEFSNYRFVIPLVCEFQGRAIYMDSDIICLRDPCELFDTPMGEHDLLARADAYGGDRWAGSVMLLDCARARFDVERYFADVERGEYTSEDLHQLRPAFLRVHPLKVGRLDPSWNDLDHLDSNTKLLHYTHLLTQPWKFPGHPHAAIWFEHFEEARAAGHITATDVDLSLTRAYVRRDLLGAGEARSSKVRDLVRRVAARLARLTRGR